MGSRSDLAEPVDHAEAGDVVGDYRLERLLGAGATSRVFLGVHQKLGRKAAIKVLSPELVDDQEVTGRLLREARVVNDIRHPNIVDVTDFIETKDPRRLALVMEYVEGPRLSALEEPLGFDRAIAVALQLVSAVQAAHDAGVIHRDLKPDNLVLTRDPSKEPMGVPALKVVDFGLAKLFGPLNKATGVMLGTPAYMAPEQIAGKPAPTPATDVFAVVEILFELLAQRSVFQKSNVQDLLRHKLRGTLPTVELDVPHGDTLASLIRRGLALDMEARPSVAEVRRVLIEICPPRVLRIGAGTWGRIGADAEEDTLEAERQGGPSEEETQYLPATPEEAPADTRVLDEPKTAVTVHARRESVAREPPSLARAVAALAALLVLGGLAWVAVTAQKTPPSATVLPPSPKPVPAVTVVERTVRVTSVPSGATIHAADGRLLGTTPADLKDPPASVRVELPGHAPKDVRIEASTVVVELAERPKPSKKAKRSTAKPQGGNADPEAFPTW